MKYKKVFEQVKDMASLAWLLAEDGDRFIISPEESMMCFVIIRRNNVGRLYIEEPNVQDYMKEELKILKSDLIEYER